jgi:uncharacterized membrane protein
VFGRTQQNGWAVVSDRHFCLFLNQQSSEDKAASFYYPQRQISGLSDILYMEAFMSHILVVTFEDETQALSVLQSLKSLEHQGLLRLDDAAVIVKNAAGEVHVKNKTESGVKKGAVAGGFLGLLIASFLFPLAGIAIGAAGGALIGKSMHTGVDKKFVTEVRNALQPGNSAILFIVHHENVGLLISALEPYKGKIYQSSFDSEAEEEMRKALL